nr:ribonucleoside-diphosphate reductase large subunit-like [Leptinotarsa decemlineata]
MVNRPVGKMYVLKRGGRKEEVHVDKITSRIQKLCYELNMDFVDPVSITLKVVNGLYPGVTTTELDTLAAETAIMKSGVHPDYAILAARIAISNLHKETKKQFSGSKLKQFHLGISRFTFTLGICFKKLFSFGLGKSIHQYGVLLWDPSTNQFFFSSPLQCFFRYEAEGNFNRQVPAQDLWKAIVVSQVETGGPCMLYKDACNEKNNQKHLGTIKCAGFCTDVIAYTSPEQIVACPQAAVLLSMFVSSDRKTFDFMKLREVTKTVTKNLDKVLDASYYALPEEKMCSTELRAIGVGVQGLADTFILLRMPFDSEEASQLNKQIFETVYYSAMEASCELAEKNGTYSKYEGSPASEGVLHYHMWDSKPSDLWNWSELDEKIKKFGLRNSLLISVMPTPLLSQILGTSDSVEPYNSNVFTRTVSSERFQVVNELLLRDLTDRGIWDEVIKKKIIDAYGSVQNLPEIPDDLKAIYKTSWEMSQKVILNQAADRAPFVDQGQCLNVHIQKPTYGSVTSMHFYGWKKGLKSGMCSIRTRAVPKVVQETVQRSKVEEVEPVSEELEEMKKKQEEEEERNLAGLVCSLKNPENCEMCGA